MTADSVMAVPATTTAEEDRQAHAQRGINRTWEQTQAALALVVLVAAVGVNAVVAIYALPAEHGLQELNVLAALVAGFYFGRTNHARPAS